MGMDGAGGGEFGARGEGRVHGEFLRYEYFDFSFDKLRM